MTFLPFAAVLKLLASTPWSTVIAVDIMVFPIG
jgi:hypothetical protein